MRLHRFFIEEPLRNKKSISFFEDELIHQWKDVFRLGAGDRLILLDNSGSEFLAEISVLAKGKAELKILEESKCENIPKRDVWLFATLIKKDNFEWILEKGTELGVSHFVPVISERSEKKDLNMERARKIVREASEQSGRGILPEVNEVLDIESALKFASEKGLQSIVFHTHGEKFSISSTVDQSQAAKNLGIPYESKGFGIFIGPEGGWTEREIEIFKKQEMKIFSLGNQILRAETAAIAVSALFLL